MSVDEIVLLFWPGDCVLLRSGIDQSSASATRFVYFDPDRCREDTTAAGGQAKDTVIIGQAPHRSGLSGGMDDAVRRRRRGRPKRRNRWISVIFRLTFLESPFLSPTTGEETGADRCFEFLPNGATGGQHKKIGRRLIGFEVEPTSSSVIPSEMEQMEAELMKSDDAAWQHQTTASGRHGRTLPASLLTSRLGKCLSGSHDWSSKPSSPPPPLFFHDYHGMLRK